MAYRSYLPNFIQISHKILLQQATYNMFSSVLLTWFWSVFKIHYVFKSLRNIYKIRIVVFHLLKQSNHSTFFYLRQFSVTRDYI